MTTQWIYSKAPTVSAGSATKKIKNEMRKKKTQKAQEKERERERERVATVSSMVWRVTENILFTNQRKVRRAPVTNAAITSRERVKE